MLARSACLSNQFQVRAVLNHDLQHPADAWAPPGMGKGAFPPFAPPRKCRKVIFVLQMLSKVSKYLCILIQGIVTLVDDDIFLHNTIAYGANSNTATFLKVNKTCLENLIHVRIAVCKILVSFGFMTISG